MCLFSFGQRIPVLRVCGLHILKSRGRRPVGCRLTPGSRPERRDALSHKRLPSAALAALHFSCACGHASSPLPSIHPNHAKPSIPGAIFLACVVVAAEASASACVDLQQPQVPRSIQWDVWRLSEGRANNQSDDGMVARSGHPMQTLPIQEPHAPTSDEASNHFAFALHATRHTHRQRRCPSAALLALRTSQPASQSTHAR